MLKRLLILSSLAFAAACSDQPARSSHAAARSSVPASDSTHLIALTDTIENLPARFDSLLQRGAQLDRSKFEDSTWEAINRTLAEITERVPRTSEREWLLGEVFESAHHVDLHTEAWGLSEQCLLGAIGLDSAFAPARIALARLYINSDLTKAPLAETLLRGTQTTNGSEDARAVHEGLAFALYYQGHTRDAAVEAQPAVAAGSQNPVMSMMVERARRGHRPNGT